MCLPFWGRKQQQFCTSPHRCSFLDVDGRKVAKGGRFLCLQRFVNSLDKIECKTFFYSPSESLESIDFTPTLFKHFPGGMKQMLRVRFLMQVKSITFYPFQNLHNHQDLTYRPCYHSGQFQWTFWELLYSKHILEIKNIMFKCSWNPGKISTCPSTHVNHFFPICLHFATKVVWILFRCIQLAWGMLTGDAEIVGKSIPHAS